jgi:perosamine synthetase
MINRRFISLYFASIGVRQILVLVLVVFSSLVRRGNYQRAKLHLEMSRRFYGAASFSFSSARGALAACLSAANVGPGDEVLLTTFNCLAVPTSVLAVGAKPVYCDIDPRTMNLTPESVIAAISPKTRAIVVQHTLGSIAPVQEIGRQIHSRGILLIEDCALATGSIEHGLLVGSYGDAAIFSMELSKTLSVGWGGMLVVNNKGLALQVTESYHHIRELSFIRSLRMAFQAVICGVCYLPELYWIGKYVVALSYKLGMFMRSTPDAEYKGEVANDFISKLAGPQAALAVHQWSRLEEIANSCADNAVRIRGLLIDLGYIPLGTFGCDIISVSVRVPFLVVDRESIVEWFRLKGVELGSWFDGPLSPQPEVSIFDYERSNFPNASFIAEHIVNIPCHSRLTRVDIEYIKNIMSEYAAKHPEDISLQERLLECNMSISDNCSQAPIYN